MFLFSCCASCIPLFFSSLPSLHLAVLPLQFAEWCQMTMSMKTPSPLRAQRKWPWRHLVLSASTTLLLPPASSAKHGKPGEIILRLTLCSRALVLYFLSHDFYCRLLVVCLSHWELHLFGKYMYVCMRVCACLCVCSSLLLLPLSTLSLLFIRKGE